MNKILYNYDRYEISLLPIYWHYIYQNEHCDDIILAGIEEDKKEINVIKFLTNPNCKIDQIINSSSFEEIKKNKLSRDQQNTILKRSNLDVIKYLMN